MFAIVRVVCLIAAATLLPACSPPQASLDLITVARKGLAMARQAELDQHQQTAQHWQAQMATLDAAFDADVKLAASGQLKDAQGQSVTLSANWVIAARKGFTAARDAMAAQVTQDQANHAGRMDNLQASDEALDLAGQLILEQMALGTRTRQALVAAQNKIISGK